MNRDYSEEDLKRFRSFKKEYTLDKPNHPLFNKKYYFDLSYILYNVYPVFSPIVKPYYINKVV